MRPTFRLKLMAIAGTATLAVLVLIVSSAVMSRRAEQQMVIIRDRYLPKVELRPQLEGQFEHLRRALQDAVAARDSEALAAARALHGGLVERIAAAHEVIAPPQAAALRAAVDDYFHAAYDVSGRLIAGETGEELVDAMTAMQGKHIRAFELLKTSTAFNRGELRTAFLVAEGAQRVAGRVRLVTGVACLLSVLLLSVWLSRGVLRALSELTVGLKRFGGGDFARPIRIVSQDEIGDVARDANQMAESLRRLGAERDRIDWLKAGQAGLAQELRGELEPAEAAARAVRFLARYLEAPAAALYYMDPARTLRLLGHYALAAPNDGTEVAARAFRPGEGLVGQAALQDEIMIVANPPGDYLRVRSGLGEGAPHAIVLLPIVDGGKACGVLELALFKPWSDLGTELLLSVRETVAIALAVARARAAMRDLLAETQRQADRLTRQEEELRGINQELQAQQEELRQTNVELTHQAEELEQQRRALEERNSQLDDARQRLEQKAQELSAVSSYKSQFLANMSHELRTPLNSMLLLSNLLAENLTGNLTAKQVEYARTVYSAGKDLLALINQVLDLAKVESGKQEVHVAPVAVHDFADHAERVFGPLARDKGLVLRVEVDPGLPHLIETDRQRTDQILNNLLGNAVKFTPHGQVALRIARPAPGVRFRRQELRPETTVAFAVSDTGVGIAAADLERVFAPFEQVDGAPDRRYGGTGLGLGISREFAALLGGELHVDSALGQGSTFTCYLPERRARFAPATPPDAVARPVRERGPGRAAGAGALLLIEDDATFATAFRDLAAEQGVQCLVAADGETGLRMAKEQRPSGIILDVKLPGLDGWNVMTRLRADPATADIPVHFVSATEGAERGMAMGAVGYLTKPATRRDLTHVVEALIPRGAARSSRVLVVEDDTVIGESLVRQLAGENLEVRHASSAREALDVLRDQAFGCIILDLSLPDMDGLDLLRSLREQRGAEMPSVVVYTARALSKAEAKALEAYTDAVVLKEGASTERLLDEVRLFVRRLKEGLGPRHQQSEAAAVAASVTDLRLEGKKILVADDDMRTVYALSATLRAKGAEVLVADTGQAALAILDQHPDVEAVLMDVMMPEMDGLEAIRRLRGDARFAALPVIAVTAKAMKGDQERCLEVGASDYLPKPIDADRLVRMLSARLSGKNDGRAG
jgi:CheY-like chemotaxis protein/signal transduction histidine kinase/HAMP domain-containing protein